MGAPLCKLRRDGRKGSDRLLSYGIRVGPRIYHNYLSVTYRCWASGTIKGIIEYNHWYVDSLCRIILVVLYCPCSALPNRIPSAICKFTKCHVFLHFHTASTQIKSAACYPDAVALRAMLGHEGGGKY